MHHEQLRDILERKQINVVSALLAQWRTNVMRLLNTIVCLDETVKVVS
jgi:hypothetical protein